MNTMIMNASCRFALLVCALLVLAVKGQSDSLLDTPRHSVALDETLTCRVTLSTSLESLCIPILDDGTESDEVLPIALLHEDLDAASRRRLVNGSLYIQVDAASVNDDDGIGIAANATFSTLDDTPSNTVSSTQPTEGSLSVMIVRVTSADGYAPAASLATIRQRVLGSGISMASQFQACSFGKLQFREARSLDITLPRARSYYQSPADLAAAAQTVVLNAYNVASMTDLADKVIFCQPPDNLEWTSVAVLNHWRINMKDEWCSSLSALIHEMGHTIGLLHSGVGSQQYGDNSGFMGFSYSNTDWPLMCFNGVKNNQLGWYGDNSLTVDPFVAPAKVKLAAFADYNKTATDPVLIKIGNYAIQYNRAKGFNVDTQAKADLVTITQEGTYYSNSVAGLDVGDRFVVPNFQGSGRKLIIRACRRIQKTGLDLDEMVVSIGIGASYCKQEVRFTSLATTAPSCRPIGKYCSANADCCNALKCIQRSGKPNKCAVCRKELGQCMSANDCCGSLSCANNVCV